MLLLFAINTMHLCSDTTRTRTTQQHKFYSSDILFVGLFYYVECLVMVLGWMVVEAFGCVLVVVEVVARLNERWIAEFLQTARAPQTMKWEQIWKIILRESRVDSRESLRFFFFFPSSHRSYFIKICHNKKKRE